MIINVKLIKLAEFPPPSVTLSASFSVGDLSKKYWKNVCASLAVLRSCCWRTNKTDTRAKSSTCCVTMKADDEGVGAEDAPEEVLEEGRGSVDVLLEAAALGFGVEVGKERLEVSPTMPSVSVYLLWLLAGN